MKIQQGLPGIVAVLSIAAVVDCRAALYSSDAGVEAAVAYARATLPEASGYGFGVHPVTGRITFFSGVLVSPVHVLTSAHVFDDPLEELLFGFGSPASGDTGRRYTADWIRVHPDYRGVGDGPDLALVTLSDAVGGIEPVFLATSQVGLGMVGVYGGYGIQGLWGEDPQVPDFRERGATDLVSRVDGLPVAEIDANYFYTDFNGDSPDPLLESVVSLGDSGSGFYIMEDGELRLAGISSHAVGRRSGFSVVDPRFVIPEPRAVSLFGIGCAIAAFARRVRRDC
jgi:hypothetical protein